MMGVVIQECWESQELRPHLDQRVLAVPIEAVALSVESEVVAVPIHGAGGQAGLICALPHPAFTCAGRGASGQTGAGAGRPSLPQAPRGLPDT